MVVITSLSAATAEIAAAAEMVAAADAGDELGIIPARMLSRLSFSPGRMLFDNTQCLLQQGFTRLCAMPGGCPRRMRQGHHIHCDPVNDNLMQ